MNTLAKMALIYCALKSTPALSIYQEMIMLRENTSPIIKETTLTIKLKTAEFDEVPMEFSIWAKLLFSETKDKDTIPVPQFLFEKQNRLTLRSPFKTSIMTITPTQLRNNCTKLEMSEFKKEDIKVKKADLVWCDKIEQVTLTIQVLRNNLKLSYKRKE